MQGCEGLEGGELKRSCRKPGNEVFLKNENRCGGVNGLEKGGDATNGELTCNPWGM